MKHIKLFLVCLLLLVLPVLFACSKPWQNTSTAALLSADTLATTAENTIKPSCDQGALAADKCTQLKDIYNNKVKKGLLAAGPTLKTALQVTDAVQQNTLLLQEQAILADVAAAMTEYISLFNSLKAKGVRLKYTISPEVLTIIVQAFEAIIANMPAIIADIQKFSIVSVDIPALCAQIDAGMAALPVW